MYDIDKFIDNVKKYHGKLPAEISDMLFHIQKLTSDYSSYLNSFKLKNTLLSDSYMERDKNVFLCLRVVFKEQGNYIHYYYNPISNMQHIFTQKSTLPFMKEVQNIIENNSIFFESLFDKCYKVYEYYIKFKLVFELFIKEKSSSQRPDIMRFLKKYSLNDEEITQLIPKVKQQENFKIVSIYLKNKNITVDYIYLNKWNKFDLNKSKTYFSVELDIDSNNNYESLSSTFRKHPVLKLVDIYKDNYSDHFVNLDTTLENINLATNIELF